MTVRFAVSLCAAISFAASANAAPPKPPARTAEDVLAFIDLVQRRHVDPPTRQQMTLEACRAMARLNGKTTVLGLSQRISRATSEQLKDVIEEHMLKGELSSAQFIELLQAMSRELGGQSGVVAKKTHEVDQQLEANRYAGTGIILGMKGQTPCMLRVFEQGPASQAGAVNGDLIEQIDDVDTKGKPLQEIVAMLRGPAGSEVKVALRQPGGDKRRIYAITRGVVPLKTVEGYRLFAGSKAPIAYLKISRIATSTVSELRRFERQLRNDKAAGLVIDLRQTRGAVLHNAVMLADGLLDEALIGATRSVEEERNYRASGGQLFPTIELAVLIGPTVRGLPEWIAAALKDNGRATLVGQPTFGAGVVYQSHATPDDGYVVSLPTAILLRGDGRSLYGGSMRSMQMPVVASPEQSMSNIVVRPPSEHGVKPDIETKLRSDDSEESVKRAVEALRERSDD